MQSIVEAAKKVPRQENLVIFIGRSGGLFTDNCKYAFLECFRHFPGLECVYLTHIKKQYDLLLRNNLPVHFFNGVQSLTFCLRAGVIVSDDFWWGSHGPEKELFQEAGTFQLWHGIPLKKIGFPMLESPVNMTPEDADYLYSNYIGYDAVLSTSGWATRNAFSCSFCASDFPELGYPRNDVLTRELDSHDMLNVDSELFGELKRRKKAGWKVVFYMPTFRDVGKDPFSGGVLQERNLLGFAEREKTVFVCKFHPYEARSLKAQSPYIVCCKSGYDPYPLLRLADVLITDYSSVYFDFLFLNRPIIYFLYDHENYIQRNRELNFHLKDYAPGPKAYTEDELYAVLGSVLQGGDGYAPQRLELLHKGFAYRDSFSAMRVNRYIRDRLVQAGEAAEERVF